MAKSTRRISHLLHGIEDLLRERHPEILRKSDLRPPASPEQRCALAKVVGLSELPPELDDLFSWHSGEGAAAFLESAADLGGWRLLSAEESLALATDAPTWPAAGWKGTYLPILDSGSGDFGVVDVANGRLIVWCHDGDEPFVCTEGLTELFTIHLDAWRQ